MSIVSIGEELRIQKLKQSFDVLISAYASTFEDLRRFAVRWDAIVTDQYRTELAELAGKAGPAFHGGGRLSDFQASFRAVLQQHQDRAEGYLSGLHRELSESAAALTTIVSSLNSGPQDQELSEALAGLRRAADLQDLTSVRRRILELSGTLTECIVSLRRQNTLVIAQLKDEINLLHRHIDQLQSGAQGETGDSGGASAPAGLPAMVQEAIAADRSFCLLLVQLQNLDAIRKREGASGAAQIIGYCLQRIRNMKLPASHVGVWNSTVLAALLTEDCGQLDVSHVITRELGGYRSIPIDGVPKEINVRVSTALLKRPRSERADRTAQRLSALLRALGSPAA